MVGYLVQECLFIDIFYMCVHNRRDDPNSGKIRGLDKNRVFESECFEKGFRCGNKDILRSVYVMGDEGPESG